MKKSRKNFISQNRERTESTLQKFLCYFIPFAILGSSLAFSFRNGLTPVGGYYMIHYLYTYKHGFVARGLVGEVLSLFFDKITDNITGATVLVFSVLLVIASSLCIGKALTKTYKDKERFEWVLFLCIIISLLPVSFRMYYHDIKLDKMLWALTLFAVFIADRKYAVWFCPVLCLIATMINPVFLFCSMILISIILLQEFFSNNYSIKNGVICGISYISMIAMALYGTISEKYLGFNTPEEMVSYYFSRYEGPIDIDYNSFYTEWLFDYFDDLGTIFKKAFDIYFIEWGNWWKCLFSFVFIVLPVLTVLIIFWKKVIKTETNKFQKFIFFLCAVSPVVLIAPVLLSWELPKYFGNNLLVQLCLIIYYIVHDNSSVKSAVRDIISYLSEHKLVGIALFSCFTMIFI
ncbi:MAG: hypothetical protein ACI4F5_07200 [Acutalibacteraceae bacterium]